MLDGTGIVVSTYIDLMKTILSQIADMLDIDSGNTRMGLVMYSSNVETSFNLSTYSSVASIQSAISQLHYYQGGTNTAGALAYVRETMLTPEAGDRSNVSNVVVLFIDENSDNRTATQVSGMLRLLLMTLDNYLPH